MGESNPAHGSVRRLDVGRVAATLGDVELVVPNTDAADGAATFAIRPEAITVETVPGPAGALKGTITKSSYVGTHMEYTIDTAAGALFATCVRVERPLAPGDAVALVFASRGVIVVAGT
jgi:iron(III) transport system ATP-binding protein